jgi:hypothetical protein
MNLVERVKEIVLNPQVTWAKIKGEETTIKELYTSYAGILAIIPAVALIIGWSIFGLSGFGFRISIPFSASIVSAVLTYILSLVGLYIVALVIDALAPNFDSKKNILNAMKVAVYSYTPSWIAGILFLVPMLSPLVFIASLYSLYLFYLGLPLLMETPKEKAVGYVVVVIIVSIVMSVVIHYAARLVMPVGPIIH